jgi:signal transduction histidine kinase
MEWCSGDVVVSLRDGTTRHDSSVAPAIEIGDEISLEPGRTYLVPSGVTVTIEDGTLTVGPAQYRLHRDEFLGVLSHELRTPLAALQVVLDVHEQQVEACDTARLRRSHAIMVRQLRRIIALVDGLLDHSRLGLGRLELRREPVAVGDLVDAAIEATCAEFDQRQQQLVVSVADRELLLDADPARLTEVLINLLTNAAKYTPRTGRIELSEIVDRSRCRLVVEVRDNGMGIEAELLPRVFDAHVQGRTVRHEATGGLGIGLSLVRHLVELHGGTVTAWSDGIDRGSRFTVELPLDGARVATPTITQGGIPWHS